MYNASMSIDFSDVLDENYILNYANIIIV